MLRKKFASRLFDREADVTMVHEIDSPEHRATARLAAEQGCVLLQNKDKTLPLDKTATKTVAVVGPFGDGPHAQTVPQPATRVHAASCVVRRRTVACQVTAHAPP